MSYHTMAKEGVYLFPVSFAQQRMLILEKLGQGGSSYNIYRTIVLEGELDVAVLKRALDSLVARHESLRTVFTVIDGSHMQVVTKEKPLDVPFTDLSRHPKAEREAETQRLIREEANQPFDLTTWPLFRVRLLKVSETEHLLLQTIHHIISDGWSMDVLFRELSTLYNAYLHGQESPLPELPVQYADYAVWQRAYLQGEVLEQQLSYWKEQLSHAPAVSDLPTDHPRPAVRSHRGSAVGFSLSPELSEQLRQLSSNAGTTLYATLLAAFKVLLSRYSGQKDVVVGTPLAGRSRAGVEGLIGLFVNVLPVRTVLSDNASFRELLKQVKQSVLAAYVHQELPFDLLVKELHLERSLSHSPIYQVMFQLQNTGEGLSFENLRTRVQRHRSETSKMDLSLSLTVSESGIRGLIEYSTELFDEETIKRMAGHFRTLLRAIVAHPDMPLNRLPLLTETERQQLLVDWNQTTKPYPNGLCLHDLFEAQVQRTPDAVALVFEDEHVSYGQLDARANQLARHIRKLGVGPDDPVGVYLERSVEMVVALLAILKAGACYLPLDPSYPPERLAFMLEDGGAKLLLTQEKLVGALPEHGGKVVSVDGQWEEIGLESVDRMSSEVCPDNLAYIIYTSGSTGVPKGVMITHRGICNRLHWMQHQYGLTPTDRVMQKTTFGFDVSVWEFFWPLMTGACLVLAKPGGQQDSAYLTALIDREQVTTLHFVPSMLGLFLQERSLYRCGSLKRVICSGEALSVDLQKHFFERLDAELHNLYGPTEASVDVTYWECRRESDDRTVPIGHPIANIQIHVLDEHGQPVPIGVPGELHIGGVGLARGYVNRPELTAEKFIPDPYCTTPGGRLYKTGDLTRYLADGNLQYLGRTDQQVKLRGFRIELGEIESTLNQHPEITESVVMVREDSPGDKRLVAYIVAASELEIAAVRSFLAKRLPHYMIPAAFVTLDALPLSPSGKLDRKALPTPESASSGHCAEFVAPRSSLEQELAEMWARLLGVKRVGVQDNFFELGGHSLLVIALASRVFDVFGVEVPVSSIFDRPTVAALAESVEAALENHEKPSAPPLERASREETIPLSFAQQRLWFMDQMEPGSSFYNMSGAIRIEGKLNIAALETALSELIRRHESLRTTFRMVGGAPVQIISEAEPVTLQVEDLSQLNQTQSETAARTIIADESERPFDLAQGPLLRLRVLRLAEEKHIFLFTMHHIISDGWSFNIFLAETSSIYNSYLEGCEHTLPQLPAQYADYAVWQRGWLQGKLFDRQLGYWRERLAGIPSVLELPVDRPRPAMQSYRGGVVSFKLPRDLAEQLKALSQRENVTLFMTLLAAFQVLLSRYSGQDDVVVGTAIAGRSRVEVEGLIGFFVNTLVMRGDLSGSPGFVQVLQRTREMCLGAYNHQDIPFERLVEELSPERSLSHQPLFQVMFQLQTGPRAKLSLGGAAVSLAMTQQGQTAKFDLMLGMRESQQGLAGSWSYNADLFDAATIERMARHFEHLLASLVADPCRAVSELCLLSETERRQLLVEWNDTATEFPSDERIHHLFEQQAARTPDAVALVFEAERLSYRELNERANRLAHHLQEQGVGPESLVGIMLERSIRMVVSLLGVLKAGGAYLPLDTAYPPERLRQMLDDSGAQVLLTQTGMAGVLPQTQCRLIFLDMEEELIEKHSAAAVSSEVMAENLAYVNYTSGSTGRPKGILIPHRGVLRLLCNSDYVELCPSDIVAQVSNCSFDAATFEVWGALLAGATLVIIGKEVLLTPARLAAQLRAHGITTMFLTTALFNQVAREVPHAFNTLRQLLFGGEAVDVRSVVEVLKAGGPQRLLHVYGPTESTTFTTWQLVDVVSPQAQTISIGRPIANTQVYVLDQELKPVPVGVRGELYIGGAGLARGYLENPELTAQRFVPHPCTEQGGERLYRTGDVVRYLADGEIEFLGRSDTQVKLRGFRIELGEIETALCAEDVVREAVVVAHEHQAEKRLVGYIVSEEGLEVDTNRLRNRLKERLPQYMLPAALVVLESLPLTANGKIDRGALREPDGRESSEEEYVGPRSEVEERLCGVWAEVLKVERVGVYDNFFELGGHSLLATRVVSRAREVLGVELDLRGLFEQPTVSEQAKQAERVRGKQEHEATGIVAVPRTEPLPLSFAQQRLWFIDQMERGNHYYNIPVVRRLQGALDITALERGLSEIVRRHESLRTSFKVVNGQPVQVIADAQPVELAVIDLSHLPATEREAAAQQQAETEARTGFDLSRGPLMRARLLKLDEQEHVLLLTLHHIISDGWSMGVLFKELSMLYNAYTRGEESPLEELSIQYGDYSVWQRGWLTGEVLDSQTAYWRKQLEGAPSVLELPTDHPRPAVQSYRGGVETFKLPMEVSQQLKKLSQEEGATLFMTLLAAFQVLLSRYSGQEEIVVGSDIADRNRAEVEGLIGFFVNMLALRTDLSGQPTFREVLRRVREGCLGAYLHQDIPFEKLVEELQPERSLSLQPFFQVFFSMQHTPFESSEWEGLRLQRLSSSSQTTKFDLNVTMREVGAAIVGAIEYRTDLFEATSIKRLIQHFEQLFRSVVAEPNQPIAALAIMSEAEHQQSIFEWNKTEKEYEREQNVVELFEAHAERAPDRIAVMRNGEGLSYGELNKQANRLARYLQERLIGPEMLVGISMERSPEMLIAMLATLKAGAAYVPIDPQLPAERVNYMLEQTDAPIVLNLREDGGQRVRSTAEWVAVERIREHLCDYSEANVGSSITAGNLAYVMYTSGSTGKPKGVAITHENLTWLVHNLGEMEIRDSDTVAFASHPSFDAVVYEVWGALVNGARIEVIDRETLLSTVDFGRKLRETGVSVLYLTAAIFRQLASQDPTIFSGVRLLVSGGESIANRWAREVLEQSRPQALVHEYGPTEATVFSSTYLVKTVGVGERNLPIGWPLTNTKSYVLDQRMQPLPIGVSGELYIGGGGTARGYWRSPEQTAEHFVPDPYSKRGGERLYRTGDLVRSWATGEMEFIGRRDQQVKLRGMRIELEEIETVLEEYPDVRACKVVLREEANDEARLVAYIVAGGGTLSENQLRNYLRQRLPDYMVPSALVMLESLPLTANGKVDQKALPAPGATLRDGADGYLAPRTTVEEILCNLWAEVLRVERVGVADNFFNLGGHSLLATLVVMRLYELFGVEISVGRLFEEPTVTALAEQVEQAMRRPGSLRESAIEAVSRSQALPLSFAQQRLWFIDQLEPEGPLYKVPVGIRLQGRLDATALERGLSEIVRRHESLRTSFRVVNGQPVQVTASPAALSLGVTDLSELPVAEREAEAQREAAAEARKPFNLATGPLFRARLLRLDEQDHVLLLTLHHIVCDGWSMDLLFRELTVLYNCYVNGEDSPLEELPVQYADYAVWQRKWLRDEVLEEQLEYWKERLSDAPVVMELPLDRPRAAVQNNRSATEVFLLPEQLRQQLKELGRVEGATLFMTLLAAFQVLLGHYSGQEDIVVGTPVAARSRAELEDLIGFFVNMLVMRGDLKGNPDFRELLKRTRESCLGAYVHQDIPFERLVEELRPERSLTHRPLFQVVFQLLQNPNEAAGLTCLTGLTASSFKGDFGTMNYDLSLCFTEGPRGLVGSWSYNADLFDAATIERMARHFEHLLASLVSRPDQPVSEQSLLSDTEWEQLRTWNDTGSEYPRECMHVLFERQVERTPEAVALVFQQERITYRELNERANRLAHYLREQGVGPESLVGICLERSVEMVVALLGVLKAGGAYVPLDPAYPRERLAFMLAEAQVQLLLTQEWLLPQLPVEQAGVVCLESGKEQFASQSAENPVNRVGRENLAYIIYTSGSTGRPKGVAVAQRGLCNLTIAQARQYQMQSSDRVLQFASLNFDAAIYEIVMALCSGAALCLPGQHSLLVGSALAEFLRDEEITIAALPPSVVMSLPQESLPRLRTLIVVGETCPAALVERWGGGRELFNGYGPTENTVCATIGKCEPGGGKPAIGKPICNVRIHILSPQQRPVPVGVSGEVYIGGVGVARGYLKQSELTAERYVPDGVSGESGARLYRTGDLARYLRSGELEFLGRMDEQVKLRGFRIELAEIEAVLSQQPQVREAVVALREQADGQPWLVAYVVPETGAQPASSELRQHLLDQLPAYMVPSLYVLLEELPLTINGKVDRNKLPEPEQRWSEETDDEYVGPRTLVEEVLAGIWAEVLGLQHVGIHQNFFDLGGHSLLATLVNSRMREAFHLELQLQAIFQCGTIANLAAYIEEEAALVGVDVHATARVLTLLSGLAEGQVQEMLKEREDLLS